MIKVLPHAVSPGNPHPVNFSRYGCGVSDLPAIVAANIKAVLEHRLGGPARVTDVIKLGIANGTAQRLLAGSTSVGLDLLERVAEKLGVQPWQLLLADLDPKALPVLGTPSDAPAWPFDFEPERFAALLPKEQGMVEFAARLELERIEARRGASSKQGPLAA
jgi:hypothetical protein